ncbi:MAG: NUDIX hydrolase [Bacillota bacterium]
MIEERLESELVYQGKILRLRRDKVLLANGRVALREVVEHPGAVGIIATEGDQVVLVKQYRYPVGAELLEIPAGKLEPGESPDECARRELREETGLLASRLEHLCSFHTSPGFSDEMLHLFWASELNRAWPDPDGDEQLVVERLTIAEAKRLIYAGEIRDAKTITAVLLLEDILKARGA